MKPAPLRIVFAGTPEFAVPSLSSLIAAGHNIVAVYSQPDRPAGRGQHLKMSPVKTCALEHGLPVLQPAHFREPNLTSDLTALQADVMIVVAYGHIIPAAILALPRLGCLNVHASLLPRWRGAAPINHAILAGDSETGITLMQMAAGLDTGPILQQTRCAILEDDTTQTLHDRLAQLGADTLIQTLAGLNARSITPIPQDEALVTYAHKIQKHDAEIDWRASAVQISRTIRAYNPWPICFSQLEGMTLRIWHASPTTEVMTAHAAPGTILRADKKGVVVATGAGNLQITHLQMPNKKMAHCSDLLHAYAKHLAVGKSFYSTTRTPE